MQYLKLKFTNIEPLRFSDDSTSQSGQTTTLKYVPGAAIRGMVIENICNSSFDELKKAFFSEQIRFLNAYITNGDSELIPSPKGFYEGKSGDNKLSNVLATGVVSDGMKRAYLGTYCSMAGNVINYYSATLGSDMRNKIMLNENEKQNVFRYEYIMPGYTFCSYIAIEDESLIDTITKSIPDEFIIGHSRSSGLGKCKVIEKIVTNNLPYSSYSLSSEVNGYVYMMLLSDATMRNDFGEYCGLDIEKMENLLGVSNLKVEACSTSTVNIKGYNRTTKSKAASVTMYEKGSVFKLTFDGTLSLDAMQELQNKGIGIRKNEGFGRIIFLNNYENISTKAEGIWEKNEATEVDSYAEDKAVIKQVARNHYRNLIEKAIMSMVVSNPLPKGALSSSQVGALEARIVANRYDYREAVRSINEYYNHAQEKEDATKVQKNRNSIRQIKEFALGVLATDLEDVLGIEHKDTILGVKTSELLTDEEKGRYKLQYMLDAIHYDNRKGDK